MRTLIENLAFAITVDKDDSIIKRASMVIDGENIRDIGPAEDVARRHDRNKFDDIIDGTMMGVCPGFVDSHVHLSETLSRAVFPDDIDTRTWVFHWAKPFYAHVSEEDELVGVFLGCAEMIRAGTTCLLDMGAQNDPATTVSAMKKIGIRGITGRHAADNPPAILPHGWSEEMVRHHFFPSAQAALAVLEETVDKWNGSAGGRIRCWVNIEGKEPCSLDLHIGARELAESLGVGTTYHLATSIEEANLCQHKHGKRPVQRIADRDGLGSNLVIAHGVALDDEECDAIASHNVKVAFCPGTSLKLAKGAAAFGRYPELMEAGVAVGLGTDGVSASGNLNLMRQLYVTAGLFKDARNDPTLVGARKAIRMATIDGAKALNWDDEIGSLEVGKKADFILFNLNHVEWTPYYDPVQALVWSASSASIAQTWINGVPVFKDGKIQTINEQEIFAEARKRSTRIIQRSGLSVRGVPKTTTLYS